MSLLNRHTSQPISLLDLLILFNVTYPKINMSQSEYQTTRNVYRFTGQFASQAKMDRFLDSRKHKKIFDFFGPLNKQKHEDAESDKGECSAIGPRHAEIEEDSRSERPSATAASCSQQQTRINVPDTMDYVSLKKDYWAVCR